MSKPKMKTGEESKAQVNAETQEMNLEAEKANTESAADMEARIRAELEEKNKKEIEALKEKEAAKMKELEERVMKVEAPVVTQQEPKATESDVEAIMKQMQITKDEMIAKYRGKDQEELIDDTVQRAMRSQKTSGDKNFKPRKGVASFMMRQNTRYAIENKPEPYTEDCIRNTLMKEMGL